MIEQIFCGERRGGEVIIGWGKNARIGTQQIGSLLSEKEERPLFIIAYFVRKHQVKGRIFCRNHPQNGTTDTKGTKHIEKTPGVYYNEKRNI